MNKQIRELAAQAGYPDHMTYGQDKVLERFAELIVRECMKVTKDYTCNQGWDYSAPVALARHFGVEG